MSMKKKLLVAATVASIGVGALGVGVANAATSTTGTTETSIVDKIAAKFGLKKADVQAVFDQNRADHEASRLTKLQTKLKAGVTAGTITQAQSDAIVAEFKSLQTTRDANRGKMSTMTAAERKAAREAEKTAFDKWVSDNKIPTEYANMLHGGGHRGHGGPDGDIAPASDMTSTSSTSN
ncbi:MAG: hypothetical protein JWO47_837 [Candidatus Saccharibacteria bacterium]|nr:hypothetical protein [Candidatus Saccharibacteria bacterium]